MKVTFGNQQFEITFRHEYEHRVPVVLKDSTTGADIHTYQYHPSATQCVIKNTEGFIIGSGLSKCHPHDQFSKETGRRYALLRATEYFEKPFRTALLQAYFNRPHDPQQKKQA